MKTFKLIFLSFALLIISCSKKEDPTLSPTDDIMESDLIGNWQAIEYSDSDGNISSSSGYTFGLYCDAILLKEDQTFVVYYQGGELDESKEDGTWSIEESNLQLAYGSSFDIPTEIIELESDFLTLRYSWLDGIIETVKFQRK